MRLTSKKNESKLLSKVMIRGVVLIEISVVRKRSLCFLLRRRVV